MKIGVLSDPHRRVELQKDAIDALLERGAQYLLHAGDLCIEENLRLLEASAIPYAAVFGNNDRNLYSIAGRYNIYSEPKYFKIGDVKVKLMHLPYYLSPDCDLIIYGHTHRFAAELRGDSLFLNPGEICAREKPVSECALLQKQEQSWLVQHLYKDPSQKDWKEESFIFQIPNQ